MEFEIHGQRVAYDGGECGIYKGDTSISLDYSTMDKTLLVSTINGMSKEEAIKAVTRLGDLASEQAGWESTPQNTGFPILIKSPGPTPINKVRGNIKNTMRFTEDILSALKGE